MQTQTQPFNVLGGVGALGSLLTKSDARLKDDVVHLGTNPYGLNVYEYRYVWSDERVVGVMAQEVAEVMPGRLSRNRTGSLPWTMAACGWGLRTMFDFWRKLGGATQAFPAAPTGGKPVLKTVRYLDWFRAGDGREHCREVCAG